MNDVRRSTTLPAIATVVGGEEVDREALAQLLREDGFEIRGTSPASGIAVLIAAGSDSVRLRDIKNLADRNANCNVIAVMPADAPNASLRRALLAGAAGIVYDTEVSHTLAATARATLAGQLTVPSALGRQIAPRPLSHREKQILGLVVIGLTNREIANRLFLAESTIKTHLSSAFRKIDARSRSEAVTRIQDPDSGFGPGILATVSDVGATAA